MNSTNTARITTAQVRGRKGLVVDGEFFPVTGVDRMVWEGPSQSGKYWVSLSQSGQHGTFVVVVGTPANNYRTIPHPVLWQNGNHVGHSWEGAVGILRIFQAQ